MSTRPTKKAKTKPKTAKPEDVDGDGIFDFMQPRNSYNNTSKATLDQYGNWYVIRIDLQRTPIQSMIRKAMDLISFGKFSSMSRKQGFDKFFHLAALVTVERDGLKKLITVEKNHVLNISPTSKNDSNAEIQHVTIQPGMTLNDMLNRAKAKMGDSYFKYDAMSHNCQDFIRWFLDESGFLTPALKSWLFQDVSKIAQAMPGVSRITRAITDVAAVGDRLMGNGEPLEGDGVFTDEMKKMWNLVKHMWGARGGADAEYAKYLKLNHDMNAKLGYKTGGGLDRDQFLDFADAASKQDDGVKTDEASRIDFGSRLVTLKHEILSRLPQTKNVIVKH